MKLMHMKNLLREQFLIKLGNQGFQKCAFI